MPMIQVTLSERATAAAQARAAERGFESVDAYVSSLVEADAGTPISAELEAELLAGLDEGGDDIPASSIDWAGKRQALAARFGVPVTP